MHADGWSITVPRDPEGAALLDGDIDYVVQHRLPSITHSPYNPRLDSVLTFLWPLNVDSWLWQMTTCDNSLSEALDSRCDDYL